MIRILDPTLRSPAPPLSRHTRIALPVKRRLSTPAQTP